MVRQPEWINGALRTLWPHVSIAAERLAARGGQLEDMLNSRGVWRPRWMAGSRVAVQGVYLGQAPPQITAIKAVLPPSGGGGATQGQLAFDWAFSWSSELEVKLLFYLFSAAEEGPRDSGKNRVLRFLRQLVPRAMFLKVGVRQVVVSGTLRLTLAPLLERLPVVAGGRLSLLGAPHFSYHTSIFGGNPFVLPGVEAWINSFIRTWVLAPFLFPGGYDLPMPGVDGAVARQEPEGLLEVHVVEAVNLPRMDWWGSWADPYVRMWVSDSTRFTTSVKSRTLSPSWDERFTLLVHSARYQSLTLVAYDSDALLPDEEMGRAVVPLNTLDRSPGATNDMWLPLTRPYPRRRRGGRRQTPSATAASGEATFPMEGSRAAMDVGGTPSAVVVSREDVAAGWSRTQMFRRRSSETSLDSAAPAAAPQPQAPSLGQLSRLTSLGRRAGTALARLPGMPAPGQEAALHVRLQYAPFTREEIDAAMGAAERRPGIVDIMRRLSRVSRVPELLRSGVLTIHLEKAEGLGRAAHATGFTKKYKVRVSVGNVSKVTERGKVAFQHKRDPVFDERLELLVDGATATAASSLVELEVWAAHFLRPDSFKGRVAVPLREVQRARRLRGSWPLHGGRGGSLVMELSWKAAAGMY